MGTTSGRFHAAMHDAVKLGDVDAVMALAAAHPDLVGTLWWTLVRLAALRGHAGVIVALHQLGLSTYDRPNKFGQTFTLLAASSGHAEVVETLHRLGSTALDQPDDTGRTPMHDAVWNRHPSVVETLLRLGSTVPSRCGAELWQQAFTNYHPAVVELLYAAGVDAAPLADRFPEQVRALRDIAPERVLQLRRRIYFSSTLLDVLLRSLVSGSIVR